MINEKKLDQVLLACGLRENMKGTEQIRAAIRLHHAGMSYTKELYPEVAKGFDSTPTRVERTMRSAIEAGFDRCAYDDQVMELFGNAIDPDKGRPTLSEFIARVARVCNEN